MDARDIARGYYSPFHNINERKMTAEIDIDDELVVVRLKYIVCPLCDGKGTHVNPSIDSNGLTAEDFEDADFRDDYFSGTYDVACHACGGKRVVLDIDQELTPKEILAEYLRQETIARNEAYYAQKEREMGY